MTESAPARPRTALSVSVLLLVFLMLAAFGGVYYAVTKAPEQKGCTLEAKICPDGSSVGRIGPNCEFSPCPAAQPTVQTNPAAGWKTYTYEPYGFSFRYPPDYSVEERVPGYLVITLPGEPVAQAGISIDARVSGPYASFENAKALITGEYTISESKTAGDWEIFQGTGKDGMLKGVEFRFGIRRYKTGAIVAEVLADTPYRNDFDRVLSTFTDE